jgi:hypothetical protein
MYLLGVTAVSDRLEFIVFQQNMPQSVVSHIFYNVPLNREATRPLILLPYVHAFIKVNRPHHLSHPTEMTTCIHLQYRDSASLSQQRKVPKQLFFTTIFCIQTRTQLVIWVTIEQWTLGHAALFGKLGTWYYQTS